MLMNSGLYLVFCCPYKFQKLVEAVGRCWTVVCLEEKSVVLGLMVQGRYSLEQGGMAKIARRRRNHQ